MEKREKPVRSIAAGSLVLFCLGCSPVSEKPSFYSGVDIITIKMSDEGFQQLSGNTFFNDWIGVNVVESYREYDGRLRISGNISRHDIKKSYHLDLFNGNDSKRLQHDYVLSAQMRDESCVRYRLASYYFEKAGLRCSHLRPVELYFNNKLQGLYLERENVDSAFFVDRQLPVSSLYKVNCRAKLNAGDKMVAEQMFEKKLPDGDLCYYDIGRLIDLVTDGIDSSSISSLRRILDVENTLDYYAVSILVNNGDGIDNNYYLYLNPETGLFEFIPWDLDQTFKELYSSLPHCKNGIFEQLEELPGMRDYVEDRIIQLFDREEALFLADSLMVEIEGAYTRDPFLNSLNYDVRRGLAQINDYINNMHEIISEFEKWNTNRQK